MKSKQDQFQVWFSLFSVGLVFVAVLFYVAFAKKRKVALKGGDQWVDLQLIDKVVLTHNTRRFRFALQTPEQKLGLPIGQHVVLRGLDAEGKECTRKYTPTSSNDQKGYVDLVIKVYPQGNLSQYIDKLAVGSTMSFQGPRGKFHYEPNLFAHLGFVAGGTGITPMFQVLRAIAEAKPDDLTRVSLVFANVSMDDILLKAEIDALVASMPGQFSVYYVLNTAPEGWSGGVGFVTKEMLVQHMPPPVAGVKICHCGPAPMNKAVAGMLAELGYAKEMVFKF